MSDREDAMKWWNELIVVYRQAIFAIFYGRLYSHLTGSEIEVLWKMMTRLRK